MCFKHSVSLFKFLHLSNSLLPQLVRALIPVEGHNQLEELGNGCDDILAMLASMNLAREVLASDLGDTFGGFFGHLVQDPEEALIANVGNMPRPNVASGLGETQIGAGEFLQLFEMAVAIQVTNLGQEQGGQSVTRTAETGDDCECGELLCEADQFIVDRLDLCFERVDLSDPGIERKTVSQALIAAFDNADASLRESANACKLRDAELPSGDFLDRQCFGFDIHGEKFIREEKLLQEVQRRVRTGFKDQKELGEDALDMGTETSPIAGQVLAEFVVGDAEIMQGIALGREVFAQTEGASAGQGGDQKGVLGVCAREIKIHDGTFMAGAQG